MAFIEGIRFSGGHVFPYSPRPGTAAARMKDQVPASVQKARAKQLRDLFAQKAEDFENLFIGSEQQVLWESSLQLPDGNWESHGLTGNYMTVKCTFPEPVRNRIDTVRLTGRKDEVLTGTVISGTGQEATNG